MHGVDNHNPQPVPGHGRMSPEGVTWETREHGVTVRVRAGTVSWEPLAGLALSILWGGGWAAGLVRVIVSVRSGDALNPGPALFLCSLGKLTGAYCAALCIWSMVGHESLAIRRGHLFLSKPWLFGLPLRRIKMTPTMRFSCSGKDCGMQADGCCCRWSTVDYTLALTRGGERIALFPQLSHEAKNWLRDRLNEYIASNGPA